MKLNKAIESIPAAMDAPSRSQGSSIGTSHDPQHDIVCGRHPKAYKSPANTYARHVVEQYLPAFNKQRELRSSNGKGMIFEAIAAEISSNGYRFSKIVAGKLAVMSKNEVRLKIGHWLRDATKRSQRIPAAKKTYGATVEHYGVSQSCIRKGLSANCGSSSSTWNNIAGRDLGAGTASRTRQISSVQSSFLQDKENPLPSRRSSLLNDSKLQPISDNQSSGHPYSTEGTASPHKSSTSLPPSVLMADSVKERSNSDTRDHQLELLQSLKARQAVLDALYIEHAKQTKEFKKLTSPVALNHTESDAPSNKNLANEDNRVAGSPGAAKKRSNPIRSTMMSRDQTQFPGIQRETSGAPLVQPGPVLDAFDNSAVKGLNKEKACITTSVHREPSPHRLVDGATCKNKMSSVIHGVSYDLNGFNVDALFESSRSWLDDL